MKYVIVLLTCVGMLIGGVLKDDGLPGIDIDISGEATRYFTNPEGIARIPAQSPHHIQNQRGEILWVDRVHQNAIAEHVAVSGDGMYIQAGWYLNNERTSCYRTLGTNTPQWSNPLANSEFFIPVAVSFTGDGIAVISQGEPFYCHTYTTPTPQWVYSLPAGYSAATSAQGCAVAVNDDATMYAVLGRSGGEGRLFVFDADGDTIRTFTFAANTGVYGVDATPDFTIFCISTYYAIYIYEFDGTRRDSIYNYGQTVAKISDDGAYMVKGDFNSMTRLYRWNGSSYDLAWQYHMTHPWVTAVAISGDGSTILAGTFQYSPANTGKVAMFDSSSSTPLWEYSQYGDYVCCCALTPDGSRGVVSSWGQYGGTFGDVMTVFDRASSTPVFQLLDDIDEPGSIFAVDISDDGSFVTAGGKAVHAREMGNGGEVYSIRMLDALANDVGVEAIVQPGSFLQIGQTTSPQADVRNFGTASASFDVICIIYDSLSQELYTDTASISNLAPGATQTANFTPSWSAPAYGFYTTVVFTALGGDQFPANDTVTRTSTCYHDGMVADIRFPFSELTLHYTKSPIVSITNLGSYSEQIPVYCDIFDQYSTPVYSGSGSAYLAPLQSAVVTLTPSWEPSDTGLYTVECYTDLNDEYNYGNDSMWISTVITTEILYDDGFVNSYGIVSGNYYDNKFAQKMNPCLDPPYYITGARFFVNGTNAIAMSLNSDSSGLPGLGPSYYIAPPDTVSGNAQDWCIKEYTPAIEMTSGDPFWFVVHWLAGSPSQPGVGLDNTTPRDSLSYYYWTDPGSPGWHGWFFYDFMMRVMTVQDVGIKEYTTETPMIFALHTLSPNPFNRNAKSTFSLPETGLLELKMYDVTGRLVQQHRYDIQEPGMHDIIIHGVDQRGKMLSAGVYFLTARFGTETARKKIILISN